MNTAKVTVRAFFFLCMVLSPQFFFAQSGPSETDSSDAPPANPEEVQVQMIELRQEITAINEDLATVMEENADQPAEVLKTAVEDWREVNEEELNAKQAEAADLLDSQTPTTEPEPVLIPTHSVDAETLPLVNAINEANTATTDAAEAEAREKIDDAAQVLSESQEAKPYVAPPLPASRPGLTAEEDAAWQGRMLKMQEMDKLTHDTANLPDAERLQVLQAWQAANQAQMTAQEDITMDAIEQISTTEQ